MEYNDSGEDEQAYIWWELRKVNHVQVHVQMRCGKVVNDVRAWCADAATVLAGKQTMCKIVSSMHCLHWQKYKARAVPCAERSTHVELEQA